MGGGDLNMKKSWHPVLMKNQEKVWLKEKEALEEKKKLDQLRKEKEEERQLQELQRLQEMQTGKKRTEKLEWMYTTPATGSKQNEGELEDYLLGKRRVDKILTADDNVKLGAAHKNFIAVQNANSIRDISAKIREDPLFAIKQQEAAAYEALMSNPLRLREMQERNGIKPKKDKKERKKEKKEKKDRKERERHSRHRSLTPLSDNARGERSYHSRRSPSLYARRSRSPYRSRTADTRPRYDDDDDRYSRRRPADRSPDPYTRRRPSPTYDDDKRRRRDSDHRPLPWPRSDESATPPRSPPRERERYDRHRDSDTVKRERSRSPDLRESSRKRARMSPPPPSRPRSNPPPRSSAPSGPPTEDRASRLAAMSSNAMSLDEERKVRLTAMLEREKAELEAEEKARVKSKGMGGFLSHEQKKVFGGQGGLEDRLKRGRAGLVSERAD
ncbi:Pre-mRNA splicing factor-domain-containing protein [Amylostereum chailletii]|nr:Pre-mRNA splicing factor-domain-containing protein [Amylostereum chailletii]